MRTSCTPDHDLVFAIILREAVAADLDVGMILGANRRWDVLAARRKAMRRIIAATGCSAEQLAIVWGCSSRRVRDAAGDVPRVSKLPPSIYDKATRAKLVARHGHERAVEIISGRDPATEADIAAWKRLGARAAA